MVRSISLAPYGASTGANTETTTMNSSAPRPMSAKWWRRKRCQTIPSSVWLRRVSVVGTGTAGADACVEMVVAIRSVSNAWVDVHVCDVGHEVRENRQCGGDDH